MVVRSGYLREPDGAQQYEKMETLPYRTTLVLNCIVCFIPCIGHKKREENVHQMFVVFWRGVAASLDVYIVVSLRTPLLQHMYYS